MKKWKERSALVALVMLLAGCSSNAQYNSSASGNVGTAWGGDVHSTVQGVSAERAWRDPAEMIVISYSTNVPSGYDRVYSIRINELEYAIRDSNFNSLPITRIYN
ncbi:lipo domain protein [Escherichia fergusonii]|nr:lipo domain protein [Escherichia fergusonii]